MTSPAAPPSPATTPPTPPVSTAPPVMVDVRAPRFAAWVTTVVLAVVLLTGSGLLLAAQAVVFALGARGSNPYALFWARFVRRTPPTELEDARPLRFAQGLGLGFALVGAAAFAAGISALALAATAMALAAALLNAAFGICLGCELSLLLKRTTTREGATA